MIPQLRGHDRSCIKLNGLRQFLAATARLPLPNRPSPAENHYGMYISPAQQLHREFHCVVVTYGKLNLESTHYLCIILQVLAYLKVGQLELARKTLQEYSKGPEIAVHTSTETSDHVEQKTGAKPRTLFYRDVVRPESGLVIILMTPLNFIDFACVQIACRA